MNGKISLLSPSVGEILIEIREMYETYFEHSCLSYIFTELPFEEKNLEEIRYTLTLMEPSSRDLPEILRGIQAFKNYTKLIRFSFLPHARELLGISHLTPLAQKTPKNLIVQRQLALYALPHNLVLLDEKIEKLEEVILSFYKDEKNAK